jgi:hypothetical protein
MSLNTSYTTGNIGVQGQSLPDVQTERPKFRIRVKVEGRNYEKQSTSTEPAKQMAKIVNESLPQQRKAPETSILNKRISDMNLPSLPTQIDVNGQKKEQTARLRSYSGTLDKIAKANGALKLVKSETGQLEEAKTKRHLLGTAGKSHETISAFKEIFQEANKSLKNNPNESLELLSKLRSNPWAQNIIKNNRELGIPLEASYQKAVEETSKQFTQAFAKDFNELTEGELLQSGKYAGKPEYKSKCPHLANIAQTTNNIANHIETTILNRANIKERAAEMEKFVRLGAACLERGDFASAQAISAGLARASIYRLDKTKKEMSPEAQKQLNQLLNEFQNQSNETATQDRQRMSSHPGKPIPSLGPFLTPLTFAKDKADAIADMKKKLEIENQYISKRQAGEDLDAIAGQLQKNREALLWKITQEKADGKETLFLTYEEQDLKQQLDILDKVRNLAVQEPDQKKAQKEIEEKKNKNAKIIQNCTVGIQTKQQELEEILSSITKLIRQSDVAKPSDFSNKIANWHNSPDETPNWLSGKQGSAPVDSEKVTYDRSKEIEPKT